MKQTYIAPQTEEMVLSTETIIAASGSFEDYGNGTWNF